MKSRHELEVGDEVTLRYGERGFVTELTGDRERTIFVSCEGQIVRTSTWEVIEVHTSTNNEVTAELK